MKYLEFVQDLGSFIVCPECGSDEAEISIHQHEVAGASCPDCGHEIENPET